MIDISRIALILTAIISTSSCGNSKGKTKPNTAETISYNLPLTKAKIETILTLRDCTSEPKASASVSIFPIATADLDNKLELSGENLSSFFKKKSLSIELHPHGSIKTINATSTDATAEIIGGFIKLLTTTAGDSTGTKLTVCNKETNDALETRGKIKSRIDTLRGTISSDKDPSTVLEQINALVKEISYLDTGILQIKLEKEIGFAKEVNGDPIKGGLIKWNRNSFNKWLKEDSQANPGIVDSFMLAYCVYKQIDKGNTSCTLAEATVHAKKQPELIKPPACKDKNNCSNTVVFRDPVPGRLVVVTGSDGEFVRRDGKKVNIETKLAQKDLHISQWGQYTFLPLSVGFGQSKNVSLSLDPFGKKEKFGYSSEARGSGIVKGLNTINDAIQLRQATLDGEELKEMQSKVLELETQQKLNKLENCRAILENGGFVCPDE